MDDEEIYKRVMAKKAGVKLTNGGEHVRSPREEVKALLHLIDKECARIPYPEGVLLPKDEPFIESIQAKIKDPNWQPTDPVLFWLRDIKDRLLEA